MDDYTLSNAFSKAVDSFKLTENDVHFILNVSKESGASVMHRTALIRIGTNQGDKAKLFLNIYNAVMRMFKGDTDTAIAWMSKDNDMLQNQPPFSFLGDESSMKYLARFLGVL
jgi:hypothetical protein